MQFKHGRKIILTTLCLFACLGCKKSDSSSGTFDPPSTDPTVPTPGVIDAAGGFNIKVNPPTATNYYIHLAGDFDKKCVVNETETVYANQDLTCIVEVEELEGAFNGINMVLNAPPSMCTYIVHYPYFYFGYNFGTGPTDVTAAFNVDGSFNQAAGSPSAITGPGQFTSKGAATCNYDYSLATGPNCCTGTYNLTTITNYLSADPQKPQSSTTQTGLAWGGKPGNCVTGSGETSPRIEADNMPYHTIYFSPGGFSQSFKTGDIITKHSIQSIYYANYYSGAAPAALKLADPNTPGNPYYEWSCLDDAYEIKARIRVQIREWNEITQFALKAAGNPDTTGAETNWGTSVNDYLDWLDIVTLGNGFPGIPK